MLDRKFSRLGARVILFWSLFKEPKKLSLPPRKRKFQKSLSDLELRRVWRRSEVNLRLTGVCTTGVCMTSKCGRRRWTVCSVLTWSEVNILGLVYKSNLRESLTNI